MQGINKKFKRSEIKKKKKHTLFLDPFPQLGEGKMHVKCFKHIFEKNPVSLTARGVLRKQVSCRHTEAFFSSPTT